jgi:protoporphyrinogen oxidase
LTETSAWAALHYFASRWVEGEGAAEFLTWPEGNGFVVDHLRRAVKEKIVSGAVVASVKPDRGTVDAVALLERTGEALRVRARRAVCAVPRYAARRMVPALAAESGAFRYSPWVVANLTLERPPEERGVKGAWDNVLYESDSLGYVVATHQLDRRDPATVWTWYRPFCDLDVQRTRAEILTADWTHWRDAVLTDLRRAHPDLDDCAVNLDVQRWGHAMVRPEPGFLFGAARAAAQRPLDGIHFAGADLGGLPLFEEAQYSGVKAAEAAMAELGHPFTSSL